MGQEHRVKKRSTLIKHLNTLLLIFAYNTLMAVAWGTAYYEIKVEYAERAREREAQQLQEQEKNRKELSKALQEEKIQAADKPKMTEEQRQRRERYMNPCWFCEVKLHLSFWWSWLFLSPLLLMVWERFRFNGKNWLTSAIAHISAGVIFGAARSVAEVYSAYWFCGREEFLMYLGVGQIIEGCVLYWTFLVAYTALSYYKRYREREIRTSQLETKLAQAQLDLLKMQLNPHFLFNSLNAISTLMHRDIDAAEKMLSRLSDLLRVSLDNMGQHEIPLRKELDFLKRYLDIEKIRFGDRLKVEMEMAPTTLDSHVPNLILQPIVENAINHGVSKIAGEGHIQLHSQENENNLIIEIRDNGPGLQTDPSELIHRTGIANTIARLTQLYGDAGRVDFISPEEGGLTVRLTLPYHVTPMEVSNEDLQNNHH